MATVTLRMPVDVVESLEAIAPLRGFQRYQIFSEGLRLVEALIDGVAAVRVFREYRELRSG